MVGLRLAVNKGVSMVTACAWCQKDDETLAELVRLNEAVGNPVSHGICERHSVELLRQIQTGSMREVLHG